MKTLNQLRNSTLLLINILLHYTSKYYQTVLGYVTFALQALWGQIWSAGHSLATHTWKSNYFLTLSHPECCIYCRLTACQTIPIPLQYFVSYIDQDGEHRHAACLCFSSANFVWPDTNALSNLDQLKAEWSFPLWLHVSALMKTTVALWHGAQQPRRDR